ncbi:ycfL protein [Vibrio ishigakensis]|uniref:YcfL protein n=1 Tax=Vibrio ishigakensis TaxID=1481914 RepID=A0A0B8PCB0_9VIBR|nr:ycfL protein [Vibrio ishigakensis]
MKKCALVLLTLLTVAGCATNTAGLRVDGKSQKVLFGDNVLGSRLIVDDIATVEKDDGRKRGIVTVSSNYKADLRIQYRFYWYDDNGLEVNTKPSAWRQDVVRGFETRTLSEVSINPEGTQFRVQIREADN